MEKWMNEYDEKRVKEINQALHVKRDDELDTTAICSNTFHPSLDSYKIQPNNGHDFHLIHYFVYFENRFPFLQFLHSFQWSQRYCISVDAIPSVLFSYWHATPQNVLIVLWNIPFIFYFHLFYGVYFGRNVWTDDEDLKWVWWIFWRQF